jgi:hypothetical protein
MHVSRVVIGIVSVSFLLGADVASATHELRDDAP